MKKFILTLVVAMSTMCYVNAGQNIPITEARIYINPGHGGWTGNDRNMRTINHNTGDTTGFYESNTNLWKGLKLRQTLIKWGLPAENVMMSRVKNGPYPTSDTENADKYDRDLTEISEECNAFGTDYFLSIHSDAGSGTQNLSLLIYNGYTTPAADDENMWEGSRSLEYQQISRAMAETLWPILTSNGIDVMTQSSPRIVGDLTFYKKYNTPADNVDGSAGYLGVLRRNTANGFLSEGYCHTYLPATHRALNPDYCGQEGVRYARAMAEWFGWEKEKTGYIMGSVKDLHTRLLHDLYNYAPGSFDQWKPINNVVVTLYKGGKEIAKYNGDDEYNGVFVFENLEPGSDYTIDAVAPGYKSLFELNDEYGRENQTYTVVSNETTYPIIYLEEAGYVANPCFNYAQPDQPAWLLLADKYEMRQDYADKAISVLDGKTIRRELAQGDSLYVLALEADNKPHIYCFDMKTQNMYFELSTEGVGSAEDANEVLPISDIAFTSDSILVACNSVKTAFNLEAGTYRVYTWEKDKTTRSPKGSPKVWFTSLATQTSGNFNNALTGETFTVSGRYENCKVITTAENVNSPGKIRFPFFELTRKGLVNSHYNKYDELTKVSAGENYKLCVSPYNDDAVIIDGANMTPAEYVLSTESNLCTVGTAVNGDVIPAVAGGATFFKYGKSICMVTPKVDGEGKVAGVELYDVTAGLDKAKLIEITNTGLSATESAYLMASSHVEGDDITLYLNKDNAVSRFTTQDVEQDMYGNVFAYDLKVEADNNNYTFSFKVNEDCYNGGNLIFYDLATGNYVGELALDNVVAGENSKVVAISDVPGTIGQKLSWAVKVSSYGVTHIRPLVEKEGVYALNRVYATVDNSPKSENFGNIYVSDCAGARKATNGVYVYNQDLTRANESVYTGGVTFGTNRNVLADEFGNIYVADISDASSGLWVANKETLSTNFTQFFSGERTSGIFNKDGVEVGGTVSSACFYGTGADKKLFVYTLNSSKRYVINIYNVGLEDGVLTTWDKAPSKVLSLPISMTEDATIVAVEQGLWVGQNKTSVGNSVNSPALMFIDYNGNITFNLGLPQNAEILSGCAGSAIAVSSDEKTLVANDENGIFQFFDVSWEGSTPILTKKYSYQHGIGVGDRRLIDGNNVEQMSFDYSGRLVAGGHYLGVFTIPTANNVCETPARQSITCGKASVAVEEVEVDVNAPVEYYNLQGVKVVNPENGIFIKKQGTKVEKVVL